MALDTAAKRSSAINVGLPWRARLPFPDGAVAQDDRQAVAFMYSGIAAGISFADATTPVFWARRPEVCRGTRRPEVGRGARRMAP